MIQRTIFRSAIISVALFVSLCLAESQENAKFVVMLYPEANNGSPGSMLADSGIRTGFRNAYQGAVEIHNAFLDVSRFPDNSYQDDLAKFLGRKYAGRKIDLVIAGLSSGLDYALKYRDEIFPGVPIVFCAIDRNEIQSRQLPTDVIGVPIQMDLADSLEVGLRSLPNTRRVYVVASVASDETGATGPRGRLGQSMALSRLSSTCCSKNLRRNPLSSQREWPNFPPG